MTDFFDVVLAQRACRDFADTPVDDKTVGRVLEAATHAPSAENSQPWVFVVVRERAALDRIYDLTEAAWLGGAREHAAKRLGELNLAQVDHAMVGGGYRNAPVAVVVAADTQRCHPATVGSSVFPAVQNVLLAANALGLGSALTTITTHFGPELTDLLSLPKHVVPQGVFPIGFPARPLGPPRREPLPAKTHCERFGTPW